MFEDLLMKKDKSKFLFASMKSLGTKILKISSEPVILSRDPTAAILALRMHIGSRLDPENCSVCRLIVCTLEKMGP
jgi:hypothetical protein